MISDINSDDCGETSFTIFEIHQKNPNDERSKLIPSLLTDKIYVVQLLRKILIILLLLVLITTVIVSIFSVNSNSKNEIKEVHMTSTNESDDTPKKTPNELEEIMENKKTETEEISETTLKESEAFNHVTSANKSNEPIDDQWNTHIDSKEVSEILQKEPEVILKAPLNETEEVSKIAKNQSPHVLDTTTLKITKGTQIIERRIKNMKVRGRKKLRGDSDESDESNETHEVNKEKLSKLLTSSEESDESDSSEESD